MPNIAMVLLMAVALVAQQCEDTNQGTPAVLISIWDYKANPSTVYTYRTERLLNGSYRCECDLSHVDPITLEKVEDYSESAVCSPEVAQTMESEIVRASSKIPEGDNLKLWGKSDMYLIRTPHFTTRFTSDMAPNTPGISEFKRLFPKTRIGQAMTHMGLALTSTPTHRHRTWFTHSP